MKNSESSSITFSVDSQNGTFSVTPASSSFPALQGAQIVMSGWYKNEPFSLPLILDKDSAQRTFGGLNWLLHREQVAFHPTLPIEGLEIQVIFSILKEKPALLWKVRISNQGKRSLLIERIDLIRKPSGKSGSCLQFDYSPDSLAFFVNGWQSWSFSGTTSRSNPPLRSHLGIFQNPMIVDAGLKNRRSFASISDMFAVLRNKETERGCLIGFLSQKEQFGHVALTRWQDADICMWADCDGVRLDVHADLQTDWAIFMLVEGSDSECVNLYYDLAAHENQVAYQSTVYKGWCSWYQYYQHIDEQTIRDNLQVLQTHRKDFPLNLVQIDDGFEKKAGDWLFFREGFPQGVKPLAQEIKKDDFVPGLWLAPFIVQKSSMIYAKHPDWILRTENGKPVNAGFGWNSLTTALDITRPAASDYVQTIIHKAVEEWQFPYLKLDFLYAAALKGKYFDPTQTRAQVLRKGLERIRQAAGPKTYLVGCGLPLGSGIGLVDSMRIGPDVSGSWQPKIFNIGFLLKKEPSVPSARNSVRNILTRAAMQKRWWINDPDCVLVRDQSNLNLSEVQTLASVIALSGGAMLFSDDLIHLSDERLQLAARLLPPLSARMVVLDWLENQYPQRVRVSMQGEIGQWDLLAYINWDDKKRSVTLPCSSFGLAEGKYWVSDFWNERIMRSEGGNSLGCFTIPAHGCVLLAVRSAQNEDQYLGSNLHFSQGMEVTKWSVRKKETVLTLDAHRRTCGDVYLFIPAAPKAVESSEDIVNFEMLSDGIYRLRVQLEKPQTIAIKH
ncbi:MAG: alpha-galactosidase [Pelolinea sp.]|nr:alpha-galactosidase [Pelolinea sp.]